MVNDEVEMSRRLRDQIKWRIKLVKQSARLAALLAGDWWCYTAHLQGYLCHCGREWRGNLCVSRSWCKDMQDLTEEYNASNEVI